MQKRFFKWQILMAVCSVLIAWLVLLSGCGGAQEATVRDTGRKRQVEKRAFEIPVSATNVAAVQLYSKESETSLPVLQIDETSPGLETTGYQLLLEFDLLDGTYEPLDITFRHLDRNWNEDRVDISKVFGSFDRDIITDYAQSRLTRQSYVHYSYAFPNEDIWFLLSGNYVLTVTKAGQPNPLVQQPFVVVENAAEVSFQVDPVLVSGNPRMRNQPIARVTVDEANANNVTDYSVCFHRNARFWNARCQITPAYLVPPQLHFYLDPDKSFEPDNNTYYADISELRAGEHIKRVDFDVEPYLVELLPAFEGLGASFPGEPQYGRTLYSGISPVGAAPDAEYVDVQFHFIPDSENGEAITGDVMISGDFTGWRRENAIRMDWGGEAYSTQLRLKQGRYEFSYFRPDYTMERERNQGVFTAFQLYTALVYYWDPFLNADRIVGHGLAIAR